MIEKKKQYDVRGIAVSSEIIEDKVLEQLVDGRKWRAFIVRSSCPSFRWGVRIREHSVSGRADQDFANDLERIRQEQAHILIRQELGETKEVSHQAVVIAVSAPGSLPGGSVLVAQVLLSDRTRIHPDVIAQKGLPVSGSECGEQPVYEAG